MQTGLNGSPITQASKQEVETAKGVSFSESIIAAAAAAGEREVGLPGRMSRPYPDEKYPGMPANHVCPKCGRRTCFSDGCTACIEREGRRAEYEIRRR